MRVYVQKLTTTTLPRNSWVLIGLAPIHAVAPDNDSSSSLLGARIQILATAIRRRDPGRRGEHEPLRSKLGRAARPGQCVTPDSVFDVRADSSRRRRYPERDAQDDARGLLRRYGGPEVMEVGEVPAPEPGSGRGAGGGAGGRAEPLRPVAAAGAAGAAGTAAPRAGRRRLRGGGRAGGRGDGHQGGGPGGGEPRAVLRALRALPDRARTTCAPSSGWSARTPGAARRSTWRCRPPTSWPRRTGWTTPSWPRCPPPS